MNIFYFKKKIMSNEEKEKKTYDLVFYDDLIRFLLT